MTAPPPARGPTVAADAARAGASLQAGGDGRTRLRSARRRRAGSPRALVVSPTGTGNLGDQAMLESTTTALANAGGYDVRILDFADQPVRYPLRNGVRSVRITQTAIAKTLHLGWELSKSDLVAMIGADVIDGSYRPQKIHNWLKMARLAHAAGVRCVVLGASCSATPSPAVTAELKRRSFLAILARDPISRSRFTEHLDRPVPLVADVAFMLKAEVTSPHAVMAAAWLAEQKAAARTVLGVNVSGDTLEKIGGPEAVAAHVDLLRAWMEEDPQRSLLFVPHVFRRTTLPDLDALAAIESRLGYPTRSHLLRPPFNAWDVKALAGRVDAVFAGRMHFAIAAFGMGTPVLSTVYQGKFEGLLAHLDLTDAGLLLEPEELLDRTRARTALLSMMGNLPWLRHRIAAALPRIKALAARNVELTFPECS